MKDQDLYKQYCDNIKADIDAKHDERELMRDDQRFAAGDQWPDLIRKGREMSGRPIQTINRLPAFIDQIVGDARQNKPSIKVHAGEDGDEDIAAIYDGLIRSIQNESNADFAYDTAVENTACFGFGAWRVKTEYESEDSFNQIICIERITDPLAVYFDKNSELPDYSDARHVTVRVKMTKDDYKQRWPKEEESDYNFDDFTGDWIVDKDQVIVAEYWHKVDEKATLYAVQDFEGNTQVTLEKPQQGFNVVNQRETTITKIKCCMMSGAGILETTDWAGKYLPIVGVNGKEDLVDGKRTLRGLVRFAKDPQRMYNYWRTIDTEQKALAPKAPVLVTAKQIEGFEQHWQDSLTSNMPYLMINDVPSAPAPNRINAGIVDKGANEAALMCVDEMKSTTGIFSASLGEQDNEKSGRAILAQQRKGDTANFAYIDNIARAIKWTGRIIIDLIPKIYDAARVV
ncbi:portal protein, partial [uncultured Agitococcus sp.]|uniref:portal protein n=1 Tax=uncultured Agitococcus sp. TaxID=1506599 RepID=UPI0026206F06